MSNNSANYKTLPMTPGKLKSPIVISFFTDRKKWGAVIMQQSHEGWSYLAKKSGKVESGINNVLTALFNDVQSNLAASDYSFLFDNASKIRIHTDLPYRTNHWRASSIAFREKPLPEQVWDVQQLIDLSIFNIPVSAFESHPFHKGQDGNMFDELHSDLPSSLPMTQAFLLFCANFYI